MKQIQITFFAVAAFSLPVAAQQARPDGATLLEPNRQIPSLPETGGSPAVTVPKLPASAEYDRSVRLTPLAFRFQGNSVFSEPQLAEVVAPFLGKPTDMEGLMKAVGEVRRYYRERGYVLTEAYLPVQRFAESGGSVLIQVLEARLGKARIVVEGGGVSESLTESIVQQQLKPGDLITEYMLEKPVLLLRDLAGVDATAAIAPGAQFGEADVVVSVKQKSLPVAASIGIDNMGSRTAGQVRAYADLTLNNLTGRGDTLTARAQVSERLLTQLFRLGYSTTLGGHATKLGLNIARVDYSLGKEFAVLGAKGQADIFSVSLTQPLIRSRASNLYASVALEHKDFADSTTTPATAAQRSIDAVRFSVLGNFIDTVGANSFTSYALSLSGGNLKLDTASLAQDQGGTGLRTAGGFSKLNLELQRAMFVSANGRVSIALQAQYASKNLNSAEKFALGGPTAVRGYPVSEGLGDIGAVASVEYRHQLPGLGVNTPVFGSVFYDLGKVKFNQGAVPFAAADMQTLSSAGIGITVGNFGDFVLTSQLAWRIGRIAPANDPDKNPRLWFSLQKWL